MPPLRSQAPNKISKALVAIKNQRLKRTTTADMKFTELNTDEALPDEDHFENMHQANGTAVISFVTILSLAAFVAGMMTGLIAK